MVSSNNNENKEALKDIMDPKLEEEVKSEADDEVEEDLTPHPRATIANYCKDEHRWQGTTSCLGVMNTLLGHQ